MRVRPVVLALALLGLPPGAGAVAEPPQDPVQAVAVGDFDGDGTPDVAVGLPLQRAGALKEAGEVRVYSGKTGGFLWSAQGREAESNLGEALAAIGDVDGDNATDLAAGAPWGDSGAWVEIHSVKGRKRVRSLTGGDLLGFGEEICAVGDGSGRNRVNVLVRAGTNDTWVYLYTDAERVGRSMKDPSGMMSSTAWVGDVDGDGEPDVAIGAWSEDAAGGKGAGRLRVLSGEKLRMGGGNPDLFTMKGTRAGEHLGLVAGPAGDWNEDKRGDLLVGLVGDEKKKTPWAVRVLSGKDGAELWKAEGQPGDVSMGGAVIAGDLDGDGRPEVAVGNPARKGKAGALSLISSKDGSVLWTLPGASGERLGEELYGSPDADGDGVRDLVVVAPGSSVKGKRGNGYVRFVSGKTGAVITLVNPLAVK